MTSNAMTSGASSPSRSSQPPSPTTETYNTLPAAEVAEVADDSAAKDVEPPASWATLPHKRQLLILAICRFSEPLTNTGLLSYLYFFLESLYDPHSGEPPSSATISRRAGIIGAAFALSQMLTGMFWGSLSDRIGRKPCIMFGLCGAALSVLGFGFSRSFEQALICRIMAGCLNGNVGVLRTMMSETVREKKHQSRAFLIMPMCFNIGIIIGPALGGILADPATTWPGVFGHWEWARTYKWALPNIVSACFLMFSFFSAMFFLDETLESRKNKSIFSTIFRRRRRSRGIEDEDAESAPLLPAKPTPATKPLLQILTPNICKTLLAFALTPLHNITFMGLYPLLLSAPHGRPLHGGLELPAQSVGFALSVLGGLGIICQLLLYPTMQARVGLLRSFQISLWLFPIAYTLTPFLSFLKPGTLVMWAAVVVVLALQVLARTFALPGGVILLTNSVEEEGVLGTVHGIGSSLASASRTVGPVLGSLGFAAGLEGGALGIGGVFWTMAAVATFGAVWAGKVKEGRGLGA
jgi:predicted MFS family arabinose efflux permease